METILLVIGAALIIIGIIGAFIPVLPGLPFSYLGIILLQIVHQPFSILFLIVWAFIVIMISFVLDTAIPAWSTSKFGGTPYGVTGSVVGLVVGLFFPPLGFIFGPLLGAFAGEIIGGNKSDKAFRSAFGAFIGFMAATGLKIIAAGVLAYYYFSNM